MKRQDEMKKAQKYGSKRMQIMVNELVGQRTRTKISEDQSFLWYQSVGVKLTAAFLLPVCFVVLIGVISYMKASHSIIDNYKKSNQQAIEMTSEYLRFGLDSVEAVATEYTMDNNIQNYFFGVYNTDENQLSTAKREIQTELVTKASADPFLENIYILSSYAEGMISTIGSGNKGLYQSFLDSEEGNKLKQKKGNTYWIGNQGAFDSMLGVTNSVYSLRYVKGFTTGSAFMLLDISTQTLLDIMDGLDFGKGSMIGIVTEDGDELLKQAEDKKPSQIFSNKEFYKAAFASKNNSGNVEVEYKGSDYLYLYSKVGDTGVMLCALIPKSLILDEVSSIKWLSVLLVLIASIIAITIGILMSTGIQRIISYIIGILKKVSKGNLAVSLSVNRQDEFRLLSSEINDTIHNMRGLIGQITKQSGVVTISSTKIRDASLVFAEVSQGITVAMNEIQSGVNQQAQDSEECLLQMDDLSDKIGIVTGKTNEIKYIAQDAKKSIAQGMDSVQTLNLKTQSTTKITDRIIQCIQELEERSKSIGKITATINSIANETNLLSLNASIEAARAGTAGSGFNVVAQEIRKLADQSVQAVHDIEILVKDIQNRTNEAVNTAMEADSIVREQVVAVQNTEGSFQYMNHYVEDLVNNVDHIYESIHVIEGAKVKTQSSIESISAVSQQTAAASISIGDTINHQMVTIATLNSLSEELSENANALSEAVDQFSVE